MDHPNELASTLAFNVIVVRFDSAFRVFNEQVSTISPESRDQAKKPNIMAITTKPAQKSKTKKQVECTWEMVRSEFTPQWRDLLMDHAWIKNPIVEPVNYLN